MENNLRIAVVKRQQSIKSFPYASMFFIFPYASYTQPSLFAHLVYSFYHG